jgi:K+-sensing histidine kinase KdpD
MGEYCGKNSLLKRNNIDREFNMRTFDNGNSTKKNAESKNEKKDKKNSANNSKRLDDQAGYMSILSHEVRTPLSTICTSADLIQKLYEKKGPKTKNISDSRIKEHAVKIRDSAFRVTELLDNIIALSKLESGNYTYLSEFIEITPFVNNLVEKVKMGFVSTPEIRTEFKLKENFCFAAKKLLDLIFTNLISNSIKFSNKQELIVINIELSNSFIEFDITDKGIGIPAAEKSKLFEPFFRGSNTLNTSGNGLGMYIVKKSVKLLKGKISLKCKLNAGTKFIVQIPVYNKNLRREQAVPLR